MQLSMSTLQHFLLQPKVFALYRAAIRASRFVNGSTYVRVRVLSGRAMLQRPWQPVAIPDPAVRRETIAWVRSEFERNRGVQNTERIKDLIRSGRREMAMYLPGIRVK
ncbi:uncharacterized protein EI90DRAFT_810158 [Cantharellus anzutake]|uniref:uncharacterized protein n=1 Tax=Cantharellus anzutake TaxID=1750568 RepID=UPI0019034763|nr:uncharacterized protein EI90DRAFT_810158 [Cantharellus anzutake]KAF8342959.1 hypothetical protein EI90DRAFT_810158 [Cantharellus anzutake]